MTRGLATLYHHRVLLDPARYGSFAWMLWSHKLCRWLLPWSVLAMAGSLAMHARGSVFARVLLGAGCCVALVAMAGWFWPKAKQMPRAVALPAFTVAGIFAGLQAWIRALSGKKAATWEPTRREATQSSQLTTN